MARQSASWEREAQSSMESRPASEGQAGQPMSNKPITHTRRMTPSHWDRGGTPERSKLLSRHLVRGKPAGKPTKSLASNPRRRLFGHREHSSHWVLQLAGKCQGVGSSLELPWLAFPAPQACRQQPQTWPGRGPSFPPSPISLSLWSWSWWHPEVLHLAIAVREYNV